MKDKNILNQINSGDQTYVGTDPLPKELDPNVLNAFKQVIKARRSIRVFDGQSIPEQDMASIFEDVTMSPSSQSSAWGLLDSQQR